MEASFSTCACSRFSALKGANSLRGLSNSCDARFGITYRLKPPEAEGMLWCTLLAIPESSLLFSSRNLQLFMCCRWNGEPSVPQIQYKQVWETKGKNLTLAARIQNRFSIAISV